MSSKKTKYLNMHDWIGTDPWRRSEISENFQKLDDKALKLDDSMAAATTTAGQAKATAEGINAKAESALSNSTAAVTNANTAVQTASAADVKATAAKTTAEDALTKAQSADATAASVQNQFDQVVINGDSSVEAAQARVDTNGQTYTTLKQRLDSEFQQTNATLAETVKKEESGIITPIMLSQETKEQMTGGSVAVVGVNAVATTNIVPQAVTPEKLSFLTSSKNIFNGIYQKGKLERASNPVRLIYTLGTAGIEGAVAVIPITAGETYTIKIHEPEKSDFFRIAVMNTEPLVGKSYADTDYMVLNEGTTRQHTFTNTDLGRFLMVYVSSTTGATPKMQVETGANASEYKSNKVIPSELLSVNGNSGASTTITNTTVRTAATSPKEALFIGAQEDETATVASGTLSFDTQNYLFGKRGYKVSTTAAATATLSVDYSAEPLKFEKVGVVKLSVFIEDVTKITSLWVRIYPSSDPANYWSAYTLDSDSVALEGLKNGWNTIRWTASHGFGTDRNLNGWGTITKASVLVVTNAATSVTVGKLTGEIFPKAQLLFVEDAQYRNFYNNGYPDLKARNIPVTWALRIANIGGNPGDARGEQLTEPEVMAVSKENNNVMSFHSYGDGIDTANMTGDELRRDVVKSIKWLSARGFDGWHWRAAYFQNSAPAHAAVRDLLSAYSYPGSVNNTGGTRRVLGAFPFLNKYNTPRYALHEMTLAEITTAFQTLKKTRQLFIVYTHGVYDGNTADTDLAKWAHFIAELDVALTEGWMEGVTFNSLNESFGDYYGVENSL